MHKCTGSYKEQISVIYLVPCSQKPAECVTFYKRLLISLKSLPNQSK